MTTPADQATSRFRTVADETIDTLFELSPEQATATGDHRFDDRLTDLTAAGRQLARQRYARLRDEVDSLDVDQLEPADAVDAQLLRTALDLAVYRFDVLREPEWDPLEWLPGEAVYGLVARDLLPAADRLRSLAARLEQVPDRLATARAVLGEMPRVHVETAITQAPGAAALIQDEVDRLLAQEPGMRQTLVPVQQAAIEAVNGYRDWLQQQLPAAQRDPSLGAEVFRGKLHLTLDSSLTAEQVAAAAREHLAEVSEELVKVARDWTGERGSDAEVVRAALDRVAQDAPDDQTIVELARRELAMTSEVVVREGLATLPAEPCEVQEMPEFRRGVAVAYCDAPGALETGGTTFYAISPTPADWPADRVRSFYREYNTAMVTNLTVHEAMPGHVLQLAHARGYHGSTRTRAVLASGSFIEGWAVHAERLMVDAGCGGVPVRLQQLKMQLRMTINALLDAGVHAEGMAEAEALRLMTEQGYQEEGEAVGKWRRAVLTSAQLSTYFVGYTELTDLVRSQPAGPARFDRLLSFGSPPPRHLATLLAG